MIFHLVAAQNLPQYIALFTKRFATGSYSPHTSATSSLERDPFGFRKVLVVATSYGTLLGIDTAKGNSFGPRLLALSALEGPDPEVALVVEKKPRGKTITSIVFHSRRLMGVGLRVARGCAGCCH
ncbi:hypothetical protein RSAG8_13312, partial [Rhizoctonia solani AG-8 WAC10335]